jgi:phosphohistidine phosphatase
MTERRIVLLRHAKAERPIGTPDFDRPLTARGHADAAAAGAWLAYVGQLPAVVICSPAKRTRQTWHGAALGMAEPPTRAVQSPPGVAHPATAPVVRYETGVYDGRGEDLLEIVRTTDQDAESLLFIGHNPGISELSHLLDQVHADPAGLRTSGIAVHVATGGWADLAAGSAPIRAWHTARG